MAKRTKQDPPKSPKTDTSVWRPTPRHQAYLFALQDILERGGRASDAAIAHSAGLNRKTVAKYRENAKFQAWLAQRLDVSNLQKSMILAKAHFMAMEGSVKHADFLARVHGWYQPDRDLPPAMPTVQIVDCR